MSKKILLLIFSISISLTSFSQLAFYDVTTGNGNGLRFWQADAYKIHMGNAAEYKYGSVTDYSIKSNMNNDPARGWTWGVDGAVPVASINTQGHLQIAGNFTTLGNIVLPSYFGNKQIFTWTAGDNNWRIGMSQTPGFSRAIATAHVQYITYSGSTSQGFAVGVNGGESSFEVTGNHQAYFRGNVSIGSAYTGVALRVTSATANAADNTAIFEAPAIGPNMSHVHHGSTGDWYVRSATSSGKVVLQDQGGAVGIGTATPAQKLEVKGSILQNSDNAAFGIDDQTNARFGVIKKFGYTPTIASDNSSPITFSQTNQTGIFTNISGATLTERMRIDVNGNVGIGTKSPDQKLTVKGKIHAEEVIIDLSVPAPDYVFEQNYSLTPLDTLKAYLAQHKHLPEVPSGKEMETNGVKVGEMEMILLKKIEEMTLHLINMNERIKGLELENKELKKQSSK